MLRPGDVVLVDFVGATGIKKRPAAHRPDIHCWRANNTHLLSRSTYGLHTSGLDSDRFACPLSFSGIHRIAAEEARVIGRLSVRDWRKVQKRLHIALSLE